MEKESIISQWNSCAKSLPYKTGTYILTKHGFESRGRYHKVGKPTVVWSLYSPKSPFDQSITAWAIGTPYNPKKKDTQFIGHTKWFPYPQNLPPEKNIYLTTEIISKQQLILARPYNPSLETIPMDLLEKMTDKEIIESKPVNFSWDDVIAWALCTPYDPDLPDPQYL